MSACTTIHREKSCKAGWSRLDGFGRREVGKLGSCGEMRTCRCVQATVDKLGVGTAQAATQEGRVQPSEKKGQGGMRRSEHAL